MYIPRHFAVTDHVEIATFIETHSFGQLVSTLNGRLFSTPMAFLLSDDQRCLRGHLAKSNPQHTELQDQDVLVTLQGPHDYISPAWYTGPGVPTWNYQVLHIYGQCQLVRDPAGIQAIVEGMTRQFESQRAMPWQPDYKDALLDAIVGFEINISDIECKYKLSQNRSAQDQQSVIASLKAEGSLALAEAMERQIGKTHE